jgi:hypothetical protein
MDTGLRRVFLLDEEMCENIVLYPRTLLLIPYVFASFSICLFFGSETKPFLKQRCPYVSKLEGAESREQFKYFVKHRYWIQWIVLNLDINLSRFLKI